MVACLAPPLKAWAMAHKGKATSGVGYNPEDPPESYTNAIVHNRLSQYTKVAREVHGPEWDLSTKDIIGEIVMRVTLQHDPLFKRSLTVLRKNSDADLVELVSTWGHMHEFGDMYWLPGQCKVLLGQIDRVDVSTPGDGLKQAFFPPWPISDIVHERSQEDQLQELGSNNALHGAFCKASSMVPSVLQEGGFDFLKDGKNFMGYPVVGYNHKIVTLADVPAFVSDLMQLWDRNPKAFCTLDLHLGILFRYIKGSTAYLGKTHDSVEFDLIYYRSREPGRPIMHADLIDEIEQITLYKNAGLPHWGKNQNYIFNDTVGRFSRLREFLDVKARFDPDGVISSQWSDQILGINGSPIISAPGCAIEGLCTGTQNSDCARGYVCSQGKVYPDARVCTVPLHQ
ncbi:hypothetical protein QOZ80_8BG0650910 [Eleusine coracana subsp. coracana]|nr:hypothetical protein QOZ80_8BG0650910 [Eleusine coracana subsp. coracana]